MSDFCGSFGINTKFGFVASGAIDGAPVAPTTRAEILAENLEYGDAVIGGRGITGEIDPVVNHLRQGQRMVSGGLVTEIGPNELDPWINPILGSDEKKAEQDWDAIARDLTVERDQAAHTYRHCIVSQARISCRNPGDDIEDQIMQLAMSFMGVKEHAVTFPPLLLLPTAKQLFWILADTVLSLDGATYPLDAFSITIQNNIQPIFRNQMTPGCFRILGRRITLDVTIPFAAASSAALHDADFEGDGSITMQSDNMPAAFGAYETVFSLKNMYRVKKGAATSGRGEVPLQLRFQAYRNGTSNPLEITNTFTAP